MPLEYTEVATEHTGRVKDTQFDIHGSVHHSLAQHKYQQDAACNRIYYFEV
jgi:hypothetical protein